MIIVITGEKITKIYKYEKSKTINVKGTEINISKEGKMILSL